MAGMRFVNKHITVLHSYIPHVISLIRQFSAHITLQEDFSQMQKDSLFKYNFAEIKSDLSKILVGHRLDYLRVSKGGGNEKSICRRENHCNKKGKIGNKVIEFNRCKQTFFERSTQLSRALRSHHCPRMGRLGAAFEAKTRANPLKDSLLL